MAAEEHIATGVAPLDLAVAFPVGTDVVALARAWFADAEQLRAPAAAAAPRLVGARFGARGPSAATTMVPGQTRITGGACLRGPLPRSAVAVPLPAGLDDVYALEGAEAGAPLVSWLVAAARRAGGAVVDGAGRVLTPAQDELVDLTVYSATADPAPVVLGCVRSVAPLMREVDPVGQETFRLAFETPYDGTVAVSLAHRAELPVVLGSREGATDGPNAYAVTWTAPDGAADDPTSVVGRIARERVVPLISRLALAIQTSAGGTVVDAGGFVVPLDELRRRASR
ncbi:hypothetical protein JCM18899A_17820 [Nocardioides sp. AN3]